MVFTRVHGSFQIRPRSSGTFSPMLTIELSAGDTDWIVLLVSRRLL